MDRILVIDDDVELCSLVTEYLKPEGFQVEAVHDGKTGLNRALTGDHLLVVLDVMLPGLNGFDVLRRVRDGSRVPVLLLTARGEDVDRIVGLEIGADDYLPKPFNPRELVARIRAILRRTHSAGGEALVPDIIKVGDVELDPARRSVHHHGKPVELTSVEFGLLQVLLREAGRVVTREALVDEVVLKIAMRCYYPEEFMQLIINQGFRVLQQWGGYAGELYGQGSELIVQFTQDG